MQVSVQCQKGGKIYLLWHLTRAMSTINRMFLLVTPFDHTQLCDVHVLPQPQMLELSIGNGCQVHKLRYWYACINATDTSKSGLRVRNCCMSVLRLCFVSGVTTRSRYQTNAVLVHDFMNNTVGYSLGGVALTGHSAAHLQPQWHVYDHCVN